MRDDNICPSVHLSKRRNEYNFLSKPVMTCFTFPNRNKIHPRRKFRACMERRIPLRLLASGRLHMGGRTSTRRLRGTPTEGRGEVEARKLSALISVHYTIHISYTMPYLHTYLKLDLKCGMISEEPRGPSVPPPGQKRIHCRCQRHRRA